MLDTLGKWLAACILGGALVGMATGEALAQPNQNHTCQGGHNCNQEGGGGDVTSTGGSATGGSATQDQQQGQQQAQSQSNYATSESNSVAASSSGASANAGASSNSGGNSLSVHTGGASSSSSSDGGYAEATGGVSSAEGGTATAAGGEAGDASASSGGNSQDITIGGHNYVESASSAATIFAGYCQSGASFQSTRGGFNVVNSEQFCDYIRLAAIMRSAYEYEMRDCRCEGVCTTELATVEMICEPTDKSERYLEAYHENLWKAHKLLDSTELTGAIDRTAGQLLRPLGILGALIWLL